MPADAGGQSSPSCKGMDNNAGQSRYKIQSCPNSNIYPHFKQTTMKFAKLAALSSIFAASASGAVTSARGNVGPRELGKISRHLSTVLDRLRPTWTPNRSVSFCATV